MNVKKKINLNVWMIVLFIGTLSCDEEYTEKEVEKELKPSISWAVYEGYQGETVWIKGKNLGNNPDLLVLYFDDEPVPIKSFSDDGFEFEVPKITERFILKKDVSYKLEFKKDGTPIISQSGIFTILSKAPKNGWHYQSKIAHWPGGYDEDGIPFCVTQDATLWVVTRGFCFRSTDKGFTWEMFNAGLWGYGASFLDKNTGWVVATPDVERTFQDIDYINDGKNFIKTGPAIHYPYDWLGNEWPSSNTSVAVWIDAYNSGIIVYRNGLIVGVDDFSGNIGTIYPFYENPDPNCYLTHISANNKFDFVVSAFYNERVSHYSIIRKKEMETAIEYPVSESAHHIELLKNGSVFYHNRPTGNLYKITWPFNEEKLNQKVSAFHFVDENVGYATWEQTIFKTIDGAQTWQKEFTFDTGYVPLKIGENKGMVWVLLRNEESKLFVLNYIPD